MDPIKPLAGEICTRKTTVKTINGAGFISLTLTEILAHQVLSLSVLCSRSLGIDVVGSLILLVLYGDWVRMLFPLGNR